jgi:regulator of nucleoside diphosphate kinase
MTSPTRRKPPIVMGRSDHRKLSDLAEAISDRSPEVAAELFAELERARVVADHAVPENVIRMGSHAVFEADGKRRAVSLVFPGEADISEGRVSVLTPVGAALIGLSAGQSMDWTARDGRVHRFTVIDVATAPQAEAGRAEQRVAS